MTTREVSVEMSGTADDANAEDLPHVPRRIISVLGQKVSQAAKSVHGGELKPTGPAYHIFRPNTHAPRKELWDVGYNLTSIGSLWYQMAWDLKEVLFFMATTMAWIAERFEDARLHDGRGGYRQAVIYYVVGGIICGFIAAFTVFTYDEMSRRKRMYYVYLLIDVFIDFENTPYYCKKRFKLLLALAAMLYWCGFAEESSILDWHNLDGLITIYGLIYFCIQVMDVEEGLVPFSKIFEREDGRRLITQGWTKLRLVDEEMVVAYVLYRHQQVSRYKRLTVQQTGVPPGQPEWMASRDDLVHFLKHEYTLSKDEELMIQQAGYGIKGADDNPENDTQLDLDVANMPKQRMMENNKPTIDEIKGYAWRRHCWGFHLGHLVINTNCVFGTYEEKDEQIKYFELLRQHVRGAGANGATEATAPVWRGSVGDLTFMRREADDAFLGAGVEEEKKSELGNNHRGAAAQQRPAVQEEEEEEEEDAQTMSMDIADAASYQQGAPKAATGKSKPKRRKSKARMPKSSSSGSSNYLSVGAGTKGKRVVSKSPQGQRRRKP